MQSNARFEALVAVACQQMMCESNRNKWVHVMSYNYNGKTFVIWQSLYDGRTMLTERIYTAPAK